MYTIFSELVHQEMGLHGVECGAVVDVESAYVCWSSFVEVAGGVVEDGVYSIFGGSVGEIGELQRVEVGTHVSHDFCQHYTFKTF